MIGSILSFMPISYAQGGAGNDILIGGRGNDFSNEEPSAIPDWVKTQFAWYVNEEIDEATLLTSMNWMFDNNLMHLSEGAAQEVNDLRIKVAEQEAAISTLRTLVSSQAMSDESGEFWFENLQPGYSEDALNHLRKAYDLNPNDVAVVMQHDTNHDKWIPILQVKWGSGDEVIIEDITGKPLAETYVFTHLLENSEYSSSGSTETSSWDTEMISMGAQASTSGTDYITYTGLEFASETVHDLVISGDASTAGWDEGVATFTKKNYDTVPQTSTAIHEILYGLGIMCNSAIGTELSVINAEIEIIDGAMSSQTSTTTSDYPERAATEDTSETNEDKKFFLQKLQMATSKLQSIQTGLDVCQSHLEKWEGEISSIGDDAQLANIDLQNSLQKQQQSLQSMANESELLHDTAMSIIRKIG